MVPLGELCEITVGRTPARADDSFWGLGASWLAIADMNQGLLITRTKEQITPAGARLGKLVTTGTVLLSFKLSIGKVARAGIPLYTNEAIAALPVKDPARLDPGYLLRALQAMDLASEANRAAMGATLNKAKLQTVQIPVPPIEEQRRIAAILDQADAFRTKRRQVLAHLDTLTQSIFHSMFGQGPHNEVPASVLMPSMRNGLSPARSGTHAASVLTLSAVTQGEFDPSAVKPGMFATVPPVDKRVSTRDFLMCRGNGNKDLVGVGTYAHDSHPDLVFPDTVIAGTVDTSMVTVRFLDAVWRQHSVRRQIEAVARTTNGTYKVNQQTLGGVRIQVPSIELQREFDARVGTVDRQRAAARRALVTEDALFASLQCEAFRPDRSDFLK